MTTIAPNGDPQFVNCNCACQVCLSGDCCLLPKHQGRTFTTTDTGVAAVLGWACTSSGHDFAPYPTGGLFCRKCGEARQFPPRSAAGETA
jgi:hypothetical protein